ncbi:MAG: RRXRR domain-containing protein [Limnoraphis sp. WC205]|jgi:hypothetical protein|nr:RRXRR domain-containing protein [Limnoraphis sp. WC205]
MSNYVFVIDSDRQPCNPIHPAQARLLLSQKKAAVLRYVLSPIYSQNHQDDSHLNIKDKDS